MLIKLNDGSMVDTAQYPRITQITVGAGGSAHLAVKFENVGGTASVTSDDANGTLFVRIQGLAS